MKESRGKAVTIDGMATFELSPLRNQGILVVNTKGSLGIFWTLVDDSGDCYQDEVPGLIFYGYGSGDLGRQPVDNRCTFEAIWNGCADVRFRDWDGDRMSNMSAEVKIHSWPDEAEWSSLVRRSLEWFVDGGAAVSWCGSELSSPSLGVFSPVQGCGSVYAAYSKCVGFVCGSGLGDEYQDLSPSQLDGFSKAILDCM